MSAAQAVSRPDYNAMENDAFRREARAFFAAHFPDNMRFIMRRMRWADMKDWYVAAGREGWLAPNWPREWGGLGLTPEKRLIYLEEQEEWGISRTHEHGVVQVGPILMKYGSTEQKQTYLPRILSGDHLWAQGYSEPNAGSDLASLSTSAVIEGDHFVVNGQKIWTSLADDATHIYMLVRTDSSRKKQEGISFLLADLKSPGITIRPIRTIGGHPELCEVFFDDVRVPRENLVGELNQGWTVAKSLLSHERINIGSPRRPQYALRRLEQLARAKGLFEDQGFVDRFTSISLDMADHVSLYLRYVEIMKQGGELG
ncbi:MAG: mmgC12, partial [Burkholderiales bacterium]|nr:mmgC12 [Burkholderiales bacterium]